MVPCGGSERPTGEWGTPLHWATVDSEKIVEFHDLFEKPVYVCAFLSPQRGAIEGGPRNFRACLAGQHSRGQMHRRCRR